MNINSIKRLADMQFIFLYVFLAVVSLLMGLGFQNITLESIPQWDGIYLTINLLTAMFAVPILYLIIIDNEEIEYVYTSLFICLVGVDAVLQLIMCFAFPINGGIIYRTAFNLIFVGVIIFRLLYLRLFITKSFKECL